MGGSLRRPKSLGVVTSPLPKCQCQTRLTSTRAVSGFLGSAIAWASSSRPLPFLKRRRLGPGEHAEEPPRDRLARPARVAADEDVRLDRLGRVVQHHRPGRRRRVGRIRADRSRR